MATKKESVSWSAKLITADPAPSPNADGSLRPLRFYRSFELHTSKVRGAQIFITAHGCYAAYVNGRPVTDECMTPGWQSYKHHLHYQTYDISHLLHQSVNNTLCVAVAPGWYASALAWARGRRCFFGDLLGLIVQLEVKLQDGGQYVLCTDERWQWATSPLLSSELYNGEVYDANVDETRFPLLAVAASDLPAHKLISSDVPPVRVIEEIRPLEITSSKSGKTILDFGQNLVGRLKILSLDKPKGHKVIFKHAEVMENGELGTRPLRSATATDTVICNGKELIDWTPTFTFHGFRYVQVDGWSPDDHTKPLTKDLILAQVLHSDMKRTGRFSCSNASVNKLHQNATWSMRGNFLSIPTDCPQRDERLGWTGDIQVFAPSANFLYDTTSVLSSWLQDLAAEQLEPWRGGIPPFVVPDVITESQPSDPYWPHLPNAVWDDVTVLLPWSLYQTSGDVSILEQQLPSMQAWLEKGIPRDADGLWDSSIYQLGDWLDPIAAPSEPGNGRTDGTFVANCYLIHVTNILAKIFSILGLSDLSSEYLDDAAGLLSIFSDRYITPAGLIAPDTQTAYSLAICFTLYESPSASQLRAAGNRLAQLVRLQQFRIATGFAGTPLILHALTKTGHVDLAYRMLLEANCPSWMYPITMGATTIWERWDSMLPDGSVNPGEMTSFSHYALGSVVHWLHEVVGGLECVEAGWKKVRIAPLPGGKLTSAETSFLSVRGLWKCTWKVDGAKFTMEVEVPNSGKAVILLPTQERMQALVGGKVDHKGEEHIVGHGRHSFECDFEEMEWPPTYMKPFFPQPEPKCLS